MNKIKKWLQFINERFHPLSHVIMIYLFVHAHYIVLSKSIYSSNIALMFVAVFAFFLKLRLFDEIKDYELDCVINPKRPLPRGLLTHRDLYLGILLAIITESIILYYLSPESKILIAITVCYSLLMFKEFFIKNIIRPHLTTYALMHTFITLLLTLTIASVISQSNLSLLLKNNEVIRFSIINWMLFNIFEFGRKIYAQSEERENVESYSKIFGKTGATLLVLSQTYLIAYLNNWATFPIIFSLLLTGISIFYVFKNNSFEAKLFRISTSAYIILFYINLIAIN